MFLEFCINWLKGISYLWSFSLNSLDAHNLIVLSVKRNSKHDINTVELSAFPHYNSEQKISRWGPTSSPRCKAFRDTFVNDLRRSRFEAKFFSKNMIKLHFLKTLSMLQRKPVLLFPPKFQHKFSPSSLVYRAWYPSTKSLGYNAKFLVLSISYFDCHFEHL